jgi:hypothetical protein
MLLGRKEVAISCCRTDDVGINIGRANMNQPSHNPKTGIKPSQVGTVRSRSRSALLDSFLFFGASFLILGALTIGLCSLTTAGRQYILDLLTNLSTGENALKFFAHLSGMLATIALIGLFAVIATFLGLLMKRTSRYNKVLAALRFTLKNDRNASVRAAAAKGLGELDVEESALHQKHEELDDTLISTLRGGEKDPSPLVRTEAVKGLSELELEQHSHSYGQNSLEDLILRDNSQTTKR